MEMYDMKRYYIIELERPVGNKKFLCLPNYWIQRVVDDETVAVSLPGGLFAVDDSSTEYDIDSWKTVEVHVKLKTDCSKRAQNYLNYINKSVRPCEIKSTETRSEGNVPLASQDTASSSPKKNYESKISPFNNFEIVEKILINVLEHFLDKTRDEPQKTSEDASTNNVKINKKTEPSDYYLYSQTKESEQINVDKIVTEHLTQPTHDLPLSENDNSMEMSTIEESEDSQVIKNNGSSDDNNCSDTEDITPTLARDDDYVEISNCADSEIITKSQTPDKRCSQTEDNLQTNVLNIITTKPNQNLFQSSTNNPVQPTRSGYSHQNTPVHDGESESDDDFEKSANSKKVSINKSSDYQFSQQCTNKQLKMIIKRRRVASRKMVIDSDSDIEQSNEIENLESRKQLREEIDCSTNKQPPSTITNNFIQIKSPLDNSIEKSNNHRIDEDLYKLRLCIEELTKKVEEHTNLLSLANSEIEKNKYDIIELKNSLCEFTNPQKAVMNIEKNDEDRGESENLNDSGSETLKQSKDKSINKRRESTMCVENENNIGRKTSSEKIMLPKEYNQNDPRWTLKYREKQNGLVELVKDSGIYVNQTKLIRILSVCNNSRELARCLLVEIFSERALAACTLSGTKRNNAYQKPGLYAKATRVLLSFVEKRARERYWATLRTTEDIKKHKLSVMAALRSYIADMRKKNKKTQHNIPN